eukprot:TRINITY_DN398_c6_g1_i1.p1 TRINITY_DN398_c6_g1~~TRINITY_DN398_c6_g1_i1.p1  ORF type:complete len:1619 (-),score=392.71 TRINITY_DN398_c6_g1_i1:74-4930(-)
MERIWGRIKFIKPITILIIIVVIMANNQGSCASLLNVPSSYPNVQSALAVANNGDSIVLSNGLYNGASNCRIDVNISVSITCATPNASKCNIDCSGLGSGIKVYSSLELTYITIKNCNMTTDSCFAVMPTASVQIKNCSFENNVNLGKSVSGGAITFVSANGSSISDTTFLNNEAVSGGALSSSTSNINLSNVVFSSNVARVNGGSVYLFQSLITFANCSFLGNKAVQAGGNSFGGAIYAFDSTTQFDGGIISNNMAGGNGGAFYEYSPQQDLPPTPLTNLKFYNNYASGAGGALYLSFASPVSLRSCIFMNNTASDSGGAFFVYASKKGPQVFDSECHGNRAIYGSGGCAHLEVYLGADGASTIINSSIINDNSAGSDGGAIFVSGFSGVTPIIFTNLSVSNNVAGLNSAGKGGGIYIGDISPTAHNLYIYNNTVNGGPGGGLYVSIKQKLAQDPSITRSVVSKNKAIGGSGGGLYFLIQTSSTTMSTTTFNSTAFVLNNSTFDSNYCTGQGGGAYIIFSDDKKIGGVKSSTFSSNKALSDAGGLFISISTPVILTSNFFNNSAQNGGALYLVGSKSSTSTSTTTITTTSSPYKSVDGCNITNNIASQLGGGMYVDIYGKTFIRDTLITQNNAYSGAGVYYIQQSDSTTDGDGIHYVENTKINQNTAAQRGAGVYISGKRGCMPTSVECQNTVFSSLSSPISGNCISVIFIASQLSYNSIEISTTTSSSSSSSNTVTSYGGGLYAVGSEVSFFNSTVISGNSAMNGGGIYFQSSCSFGKDFSVTENSVSDNLIVYGGGLFLFDYSHMKYESLNCSLNKCNPLPEQKCYGGGIFLSTSSNLLLVDSEVSNNIISTLSISNNISTQSIAPIRGGGSAIFTEKFSTLYLNNSLVSNNAAIGTHLYGGGIMSESDAKLYITMSSIKNNKAMQTEIYQSTSSPSSLPPSSLSLSTASVSKTTFGIEDIYAGVGGGIHAKASEVYLYQSVIDGNEAHTGGGISSVFSQFYLQNSTVSNNFGYFRGGAGIVDDTTIVTLGTSSSITNNRARFWGGIYIENHEDINQSDIQQVSQTQLVIIDNTSFVNANPPAYYQYAYAPNCIAFGPGIESARVNTPDRFYFTILSRDRFSGKTQSTDDEYSVNITSSDGVALETTIKSLGDGTYSVTYRQQQQQNNNNNTSTNSSSSTVKAARYTFTITLKDRLTGMIENISGTPKQFLINAGPISVSDTVFENIEAPNQCEETRYRIQLYDQLNNKILVGGENVLARVSGDLNFDVNVVDNNDGSYDIPFYIAIGGKFEINVTVNGQHVPTLFKSFEISSSGSHICWKSGLTFMLFIILAFMLVLIISLIMVWVYRNTPVIKRNSPLASALILFGALLIDLSVALTLIQPSAVSCNLSIWFHGTGFALLFGAMFAHNYRIFQIFDGAKRLKFKSLPDSFVLMLCSVVAALKWVLLVIWMAVDYIKPAQEQLATLVDFTPVDTQIYTITCDPNRAFLTAFFVYQMILMAIGTYISISVRKLQRKFNHSKDIAFAIYSYFFVIIIQVIFTWTDTDFWTRIILTGLLMIMKVLLVVGVLYGPAIFLLSIDPSSRSRSSNTSQTSKKSVPMKTMKGKSRTKTTSTQ